MKLPARAFRTLSPSVNQRLNMYALAAGATGVGMLALTPLAEARVVYTPAHAVIGRTSKVFIDLNHDGKNDFEFRQTFLTTSSVGEVHSLFLSALPAQKGNQIWGVAHKANALFGGVKVGPKSPFSNTKQAMAVDYYADGTGGSGTCADPWNNVKNRYLGLKFTINGKTHFGWARLNVACVTMYGNHVVTGTLTGYAYETTPNTPIVTGVKKSSEIGGLRNSLVTPVGEHLTLGLLAMGAPARLAWRRKESAGSAAD
jgi:hypothetical protein